MGFLARSLGEIALALEVAVQALAAPVIQVPQPITVECSGNLSATVNLPAATAPDAAGSVAVFGPRGPTAFNLGTTQLTYTAQDAGGTTVAISIMFDKIQKPLFTLAVAPSLCANAQAPTSTSASGPYYATPSRDQKPLFVPGPARPAGASNRPLGAEAGPLADERTDVPAADATRRITRA